MTSECCRTCKHLYAYIMNGPYKIHHQFECEKVDYVLDLEDLDNNVCQYFNLRDIYKRKGDEEIHN